MFIDLFDNSIFGAFLSLEYLNLHVKLELLLIFLLLLRL